MARRLFVVNTLFQLMTAINMSLNIMKKDKNDIFITDCSVSADTIAENLKNECIFENVYYILTEEKIQTKTLKDKANRFIEYCFSFNNMYEDLIPNIKYEYEELLFYNYDTLVTYIFKKILLNNPEARWSRFEEGYISYFYGDIESRIVKITEKMNKLFGRGSSMANHVDSYYFYEPQLVLFSKEYQIRKIPKIDRRNQELVECINRVFGISSVPDEYEKVKYIFFEEQFSFDNSGVDDLSLIRCVAEHVGRDNILIKTHPRNRVNRFKDLNIKTNAVQGVPWEVIHLNRSFEDKIFIAISCGSILSSKILYSDNVPSFLLYKCANRKPPLVNDKYEEFVSKLCKLYGKSIFVPDNMDRLFENIS